MFRTLFSVKVRGLLDFGLSVTLCVRVVSSKTSLAISMLSKHAGQGKDDDDMLLTPLAYVRISEKNPSTSALTLSDEMSLGLDWKKSFVTYTMFLTGLIDGSRAESWSFAIALEKRSLMASRGNGAVICGAHLNPANPPPVAGAVIFQGLQVLPSML